MYEAAAAASISGVIASWLTPSSLFIFLNVVIATILISSRFTSPKTQIHEYQPSVAQTEFTHPQLLRTPSLLERVKSFNLIPYNKETEYDQPKHENPYPNTDNKTQEPKLARAPSLLQRLQSIKVPCSIYRSDSMHVEKEPEMEGPDSKMRESASEDEKNEGTAERRRSERTWLREEEEEGVDAKADDFIKRFKKQLRLQRVDSILRYRDMLKRIKLIH